MSIILGILCLGFLVFFHESGHFIAARLFGVKVLSFSIGMGPIIFHKEIGKTDYRISLIPLGGYCGMKGEQDFRIALEEGKDTIEADKDSFYGVHPIKRSLIAFAGPFFNFIFAIIAFTLIALIGYTYTTASAKVLMADQGENAVYSAAHEAGLQDGDIITAINNTAVSDFSDIADLVAIHPDEIIKIDVDRNGQELSFDVKTILDKETGRGLIGVKIYPDTIVEKHSPDYNLIEAIGQGFKQTFNTISGTITGIKTLFKGVKIANAVSGPARITTMLGDTVKASFKASISTGIVYTLQFLALISVSLFIMNLLPIPILDGGLILNSFIELILKRKLSPKFLYRTQFIGLAIIAILFIIAMYGDVIYFMTRK